MANKLQKHARAETRAALENASTGLVEREIGINVDDDNASGYDYELVVEYSGLGDHLHIPSEERLAYTGANKSGAEIVFTENNFTNFTGGQSLQDTLESIDTAITAVGTLTGVIYKDGSVNMEENWICEKNLTVQGNFYLGDNDNAYFGASAFHSISSDDSNLYVALDTGDMYVDSSLFLFNTAGSPFKFISIHSDETGVSSSSDCGIRLYTNGAATPQWVFGLDDSDGDNFYISRDGSYPGTGTNVFKIDYSTNAVTLYGNVIVGTNNIGYDSSGSLSFDASNNATFSETLSIDKFASIGDSTPSTTTMLNINDGNSIFTGTSQFGTIVQPNFNENATVAVYAHWTQLVTYESGVTPWVTPVAASYYIKTPAIDANNTITTLYGIYMEDMTGGGVDYAIYTGAGTVRFGGATVIQGNLTLNNNNIFDAGGLWLNSDGSGNTTANGTLSTLGNVTIGQGTAATDYLLTFNGETTDYEIQHFEDEGELRLSGDVSGGNYTAIEADGTIEFNGNATTWEDINIDLSPLQSGGTAPGFATYGGIRLRSWAVGEDVDGAFEIKHSYKLSSTMTFHIHFLTNGAPTGTDYVKWQVEYWIVDNGGSVSGGVTTIDTGDIAVTAALTRYDANFTTTLSHATLGGQLGFKITRIAATGDAYADEVGSLTVGVHIEQDMTGSRQITTK